jgi:hypothetical protein
VQAWRHTVNATVPTMTPALADPNGLENGDAGIGTVNVSRQFCSVTSILLDLALWALGT